MKKKKRKIRIWIWLFSLLLLAAVGTVAAGAVLMLNFRSDVRQQVVVEAGDPMPTISDFLSGSWEGAEFDTEQGTDITAMDSLQLGVYEVVIKWGPFSRKSTLIIHDTVAPTGTVQDLVCSMAEEPKVEDFVTSAEDITGVKMYFLQAPEMTVEGNKPVQIYLEDGGGNRTLLKANLLVYDPDYKPVISGMLDKTLYEGESVSYRPGIMVKDDLDPDPILKIDSSGVNLDKPGVYRVTYTAEDRFGRTASETIRVNVMKKPDNYDDMMKVEELSRQLVEELITENMNEIERAFVIYRWVRLNIPWNNARTSRDEVEQTLNGLTGMPGDCYTHAITCKKLLDQAGIENIFMHRDPGPGQHYWLMVKVNDEWYHMDPSPVYTSIHICFLGTDMDCDEFMKKVRPNYYARKVIDFPATPYYSPARVRYKQGDYYLEIFE